MRLALLLPLLLLAACDGASSTTSQPGDATQIAITQARAAREAGKPAEALIIMQMAHARTPADPQVMLHYGYALISAGAYEPSVEIFDTLTAMQPENAAAYNGKAVAFDHAGNHTAAQELYEKALSLKPSDVASTNNLAMSHILSDEPKQAIALLEPLQGGDRAVSTIRQNLALAYSLSGDEKQALAINLRDLSESEAKQNMKFYAYYRKQLAAHRQDELLSRALFDPSPEPKPKKKPEAPAKAEAPKPAMPEPEAVKETVVETPKVEIQAPAEEPKPEVVDVPVAEVEETAKPEPEPEEPVVMPHATNAVPLPKGYKPSTSAIDAAPEPESGTFMGYKAEQRYPSKR